MVCTTVSGSKPNASCIFPFKFNGITFDECTTMDNAEGDLTPWCSTLVDDSGEHVYEAGNWGHCGPDCNLKNDNTLIRNFRVGKSGRGI